MTRNESKKAAKGIAPECPACGKAYPGGAVKCPSCGENLLLGVPDLPPDFDKDRHKEERRASARSRVLFWIGLALFLIGGPILTLFSLIHNYIGYPPRWFGRTVNADAYGWLDQTYGAIGLAVMAIGIVFLLLSLKRREGKPRDDGFDPANPRGYDE